MNKMIDLLKSLIAHDEPSADDKYLAAATDIYDLERRMRDLDSRTMDISRYPIISYG